MVEAKKNEIESSDEEVDTNYENGELVKCRFYRNQMPQKEDLVAVITTQLRDDMGASVMLLEYDNMEGFIMLNHASTRRVRSVHKVMKIGKKEMMEVLRVDEEKKCIDLSKKNMKADAIDEAYKRYIASKKVHAIMRQTAIKLKTPVIELYERWGWDLYDNFEHAHDAFRIALSDPQTVFSQIDIPEEH